jgi:hypothetical protein
MRLSLMLTLLCACAAATPAGGSVADLIADVRASLKAGQTDREIAGSLHDRRLTERLEPAVTEQLESEGAGPATLEELERQQWLTAKLSPPAQPPRLFEAPPAPQAGELSEIIEKARAIALQYTAALPNFLCTQSIRRFNDSKGAENWKQSDSLKLDVGYSEKGERYRVVEINGHPATRSFQSLGGFSSNGEFGTLQKWIFDPESRTDFRFERWTNLRGLMAYVFAYNIEQPRSHYEVNWNTFAHRYHMTTGMSGVVYIDRETFRVLRFTHGAVGLPGNWPITGTPAVIDYAFAEVGGQQFLLPKRVDSRVLLKGGAQDRNLAEFTNYRKFASEATVTFEK